MPKRITAEERTEAGRQDAGAYFSRGLRAPRCRILTPPPPPPPSPSPSCDLVLREEDETRRRDLASAVGLTLPNLVTVQQVPNKRFERRSREN